MSAGLSLRFLLFNEIKKQALSIGNVFIGMKEDDTMFKKRIERGKSSIFIYFFGVEAYDIEICNKNVIQNT